MTNLCSAAGGDHRLQQLDEVTAKKDAGRPLRILLVDDDLSIRNLIENYLSGHNMRIVVANGREAMLRQF
ncbi:MAG TPA: hypothetical protein VGJ01_18255, partial [Pseudolabrys sp.]